MNIVFLCGSLEKGKDGVGDYCHRLSLELIRSGHSCMLIALNDPFIKDTTIEINSRHSTIRLPSIMNLRDKVIESRKHILTFNPALISLQFVSYSFNSKGIVFFYSSFFRNITRNYPVHIMFHELWLGAHIGAGLKERLIGRLQKKSILKLIHSLKPFVIHVNSNLFKFLLKKNQIESKALPVFGNIRKIETPSMGWIYNLIGEKLDCSIANRQDWIVLLFFGSINASLKFSKTAEVLKRISNVHSKKILICSAGKLGNGDKKWEYLTSEFSDSFVFCKFGELEESKISDLISFSDFGLTSYPDILIEKSGSIATMLEHQLPVIISNFDLKIEGYNKELSRNPLLIDIHDLEDKLNNPSNLKDSPFLNTSLKVSAEVFLREVNLSSKG